MFCLCISVWSPNVVFLPQAGVLTDTFSDIAAVLLAVTSLFGASARYAAVLARRDKDEIERATAAGFFFGFWLALLTLLVDRLA
jgi:hypothetical protein